MKTFPATLSGASVPRTVVRLLAAVAALLFVAPPQTAAQSALPLPVYRWTTLAGRASVGTEDGSLTDARFAHPHGLARDALGNLYVADTGNHTIRKITPTGLVSTFAGRAGLPGSADGTGSAARFNRPESVGVDANGNVYVADTGNHTIRLITPTGVVSTLAGQTGNAGYADGATASARFDSPSGLIVAPDGTVYLENHGLRKIAGGQVTTLQLPETARAADGSAVRVSLGAFAADANGRLYFRGSVTDVHYSVNRCLVRREADGTLTLWWFPNDYSTLGWSAPTIFNDVFGNLYLTHNYPGIGGTPGFREGLAYNPATHALTQRTIFVGVFGEMDEVRGIAVDASTGRWFYTRASDSAIASSDGPIFAGTAGSNRSEDGTGATARFTDAESLTVARNGEVWVLDRITTYGSLEPYWQLKLRQIPPAGITSSSWVPLQFSMDYQPGNLSLARDANDRLLASIYQAGNRLLRRGTDDTWQTLPLPPTFWQAIRGSTVTADGKLYLIAYDGIVYRYEEGGSLTAIAGGSSATTKQDGAGNAAKFNSLVALCSDDTGNLYVIDSWENASYVRQITPAGTVTTLVENANWTVSVDGGPCPPSALVVDREQNIFLSYSAKSVVRTDSFGWSRAYSYGVNTIRRIARNGEDTLIGASPGNDGADDGLTGTARFSRPTALALDRNDNLYVIDDEGRTIRKAVFVGRAPTLSRQPASATVNVGASATFSVEASAGATPSYQWYFNGTAIAGATSAAYTVSSARSTDAGDYTVVVANEVGSVTSNKATLTVTNAPPPPPSGGGSGGGGGAPSLWFGLAVVALVVWRQRLR